MDDNSPVHFVMQTNIFPTGAEQWACPFCSYKIIVAFLDPLYPVAIVIDGGQPMARHVARPYKHPDNIQDNVDEEPRLPENIEEQINSLFDNLERQ